MDKIVLEKKRHLPIISCQELPMKTLITVLTAVFLSGCSVFGLRTADEPNYQTLNDYGYIQIRQYPALVVAQTELTADYKKSSSQGFQRLAGYIFGKIRNSKK